MMARTQISLDSETQKAARRRAQQLGVSFAEYVRRLVNRDLDSPRKQADIRRIFGLGDSGASNVAQDKDAMVNDAVDALRRY